MCVSEALGSQRSRLCCVLLGRAGGCPVLIVLQMACLPPFETFTTWKGRGNLLRCQELLRASKHHDSSSSGFSRAGCNPGLVVGASCGLLLTTTLARRWVVFCSHRWNTVSP